MTESVRQQVLEKKLIAILRGLDPETCRRTAAALFAGGVTLMEVTFRPGEPSQRDTLDAVERLAAEYAGKIIPGAGTVLTPEQVEQAFSAGAKYIISPNCDRRVIRRTKELGMLSIPGAFTPTEIAQAAEFGADFVKVFPCFPAGPEYVRAIRGPLRHIPLLAVGGVDLSNLRAFLDAGCAGAGIGGRLVDPALIQAGRYQELTELARRYCSVANGEEES